MRIKLRIPIITVVSIVLSLVFMAVTVLTAPRNNPYLADFQFWVMFSMVVAASAGAHWLCGELPARVAIGIILGSVSAMGLRYMYFVFESPPSSLTWVLGIGCFAGSMIMAWGILRYHHDLS